MKTLKGLLLGFVLSGCQAVTGAPSPSQPVELVVFAAGSLTEAFTESG